MILDKILVFFETDKMLPIPGKSVRLSVIWMDEIELDNYCGGNVLSNSFGQNEKYNM